MPAVSRCDERPEVAEEQRHLDRLAGIAAALREEVERQYAESLRSGNGYSGGLAERDLLVQRHAHRLSELRATGRGLVFGRLELDGGDSVHIGRVGLRDPRTGDRALVDWRAPAARPFYTATPAHRQCVKRRRHITTVGARVMDVHDESLTASGGASPDSLASATALFAALEKPRTHQMSDIVQTIQAQQDEIIRAGWTGTLVVQGGPGTGKTAVALHRAAYLLYQHRERLQRSCVLVVGPNASFLRYISSVLPGLGESSVVLATMSTLLPGIDANATEPAVAAEVKGRLLMAEVLHRSVKQLQCPVNADATLRRPGEPPISIPARVLDDLRSAVRARELPHNESRPHFEHALLDYLADQVLQRLGYDSTELEAERQWTRADLADDSEVQALLDRLWPVVHADDLLRSLFASRPMLTGAGGEALSDEEVELLLRDARSEWTPADVPLLDELAELLGEDPREVSRLTRAHRQSRQRDVQHAQEVLSQLASSDSDEPEGAWSAISAEALAARHAVEDHRTPAERAASDRGWMYGHVIVDEAQELSPMALRALLRRASLRSMTLVGDMNQVSTRDRDLTWDDLLAPQLRRWTTRELTVNYRTPARVMKLATRVLSRIDPAQPAPIPIRDGAEPPLLLLLDQRQNAVSATRRLTGHLLQAYPSGTVGVIATAAVASRLPDSGTAGARMWVGSHAESKGLEFDTVVLVAPTVEADGGRQRLASLYVALTRATQRIVLLAAEGWAESIFGPPEQWNELVTTATLDDYLDSRHPGQRMKGSGD